MWLVGLSFCDALRGIRLAPLTQTPTISNHAAPSLSLRCLFCRYESPQRRPAYSSRPHPRQGRRIGEIEEFCRRGDAGREKSRAHGERLWPGGTQLKLPFWPRPFRRPSPVAPLTVTSRGDQ